MLLSDQDIQEALLSKKIILNPLPNFKTALSASSIDLRLNNTFKVFEYSKMPYFDPRKSTPPAMKTVKISDNDMFILQPGEFALASTLEWIELPDDIAGRLDGRSSIGRLGVVVHSTAGLVHPGMRGNLVLELSNHSRMPIALYPKMRICVLSFEKLTKPSRVPYYKQKNAKYIGQKGTQSTKINKD